MRIIYTVLISLVFAIPCYADRGFFVLPMQGGSPVVDTTKTPVYGWVLIEQYKTTGLYQVTGTTAQLDALGKATKVVPIVKVTDTKPTAVAVGNEEPIEKGAGDPVATKAWAELDTKPVKADTDALNTLLTAESAASVKPTVSETMTYREVITKMVSNPKWEVEYWVKDAD